MIRGIRSIIAKLQHDRKGITITELVVVLPIITIVIVLLVGILFSQYGTVLAEARRSSLRAEAQSILNGLQDEFLFSITFGQELDDGLNDPHAPMGGWDFDTDPSTLIIYEIALDSNRRDEERKIVRRRLSSCTGTNAELNPTAINNIIYYVEDNPNNNFNQLVRRTVTPTYATCSEDRATGDTCVPTTVTCLDNSRTTSCPADQVAIDPDCDREDVVVNENLVDFNIEYFLEDNIPTPFADSADQLELTMVLGDRVFGRDVEVEVVHRIRKIN